MFILRNVSTILFAEILGFPVNDLVPMINYNPTWFTLSIGLKIVSQITDALFYHIKIG